ncbi:MAG: nucleotide sugar dehydrogenase [Proteobacteria bacterium]|nr:nucleotide sugar dehydrogenase [Pseudomonadota bacterium]
MNRKIAVIGLGYVGLPVALAFAKKFPGTIGFDINQKRVNELKNNLDETKEIDEATLKSTDILFTANEADLKSADFFVVAVPTPIDEDKRPDLHPVISASKTVGRVIRKGAIVVYESTVYPGVTEEICGPVLEMESGLKQSEDFKLGYSPERINPGDKEHTLESIIKIVSGEDADTLAVVADVYGTIVNAGVHKASSIKVAEAAKVIENTQRDLNIALMNELALIFDRMSISTKEVLEAAGTKWNFLKFSPGLVGGHCIGVDPYYLTTKAEQLGYRPQVILAGRRINDSMGQFIAQKTVKLMINAGHKIKDAKIGVLGITFKENVPDIRNSRVPDIINELNEYGIKPLVYDPIADTEYVRDEYGFDLVPLEDLKNCDAIILAVSHKEILKLQEGKLYSCLKDNGILVDVKSVINPLKVPETINFWRL